MDAPILATIWDASVPEARRYRDIENHYALQRVETNTRHIAQFQAANLAMQAQIADQSHHDLMELGWGLDNLNDGLAAIEAEMGGLRQGIGEVARGVGAVEEAIWEVGGLLAQCLGRVSEQLHQQQLTMDHIADTLRRPLETQVLELRKHADHALKSGNTATGKRRAEWFSDGLGLLRQTTDNPVGKQDYVAWFQTGWLLWKSGGDLAEAEAAFDRAARLAGPAADVYLWESLRHLAYMRYLQGNREGAWEAIGEALEAERNPRTLFDGARYAAVNDRVRDAVHMLEQGIRAEPTMVVEMLGEVDFDSMRGAVEELVDQLVKEARAKATRATAAWGSVLERADKAQEIAGCKLDIPAELGWERQRQAEAQVGTADYLVALQIDASGQTAVQLSPALIREGLGAVRGRRDAALRQAEERRQSAPVEAQRRKTEAETNRRRAADQVNAMATKDDQAFSFNRSSTFLVSVITGIIAGVAAMWILVPMGDGVARNVMGWVIAVAFLTPPAIGCVLVLRSQHARRSERDKALRDINAIQDEAVRRIDAEMPTELARLESEAKRASAELAAISQAIASFHSGRLPSG